MNKRQAKDSPRKGDPQFSSGFQAGWSAEAGRWLTKEGKFSTRSKVLAENATVSKDNFGGSAKFRFPTPITSNFEIIESVLYNGDSNAPMSGVGGVLNTMVQSSLGYGNRMQASYEAGLNKWSKDRGNKMLGVKGFDKTPESKPMPNYMPVQIQTRFSLAEHYYNTDGDVMNIVDAPIELLSRKIDVICGDKRLRTEIETFIAEKNLEAVISQMWSVMREYGQAYPFEIWDDPDNPRDLISIVHLPPKSVHIGYNWAYGLSSDYAGADAWTESLLNAVFPPAMFKILMRHWNDSPMYEIPANGVLLSGNFLRPVFDRNRDWMRYSMPMISRVFRELVDRVVYQDSVRALVEGYKYQLWVIKLGDADHIPLPQEIAAVRQMVTDVSGDRTGMFVWRNAPFEVEVHAPKGLQEMISNDYYGGITKEILRKMGITSQVISGETPGTLGSAGGRGAAADKGDMNVQLFFERSRYQSRQILDWLVALTKKWVRNNTLGKKLPVKELNSLSFDFAPTYVEMAGRVSEIYGPMYRDGALSHHTYVGAAGLKGDIELSYKEDETDARESGLLNPPVTFAQMVVNAQGDTKTVEQTEPQGSPDKAMEQNNAAQDRGNLPQKMTAADFIQPIALNPSFNVTMPQPQQTFNIDARQPEQPAPVTNVTVEAAQINLPEQPAPVVNVEAPEVNVHVPRQIMPDVNINVPRQPAPVVNVAPPNVVVEAAQVDVHVPEQPAPVVTVEAAQIHIEKPDPIVPVVNVDVHVPEQPAPVVNVEAPDVTVLNQVQPTPVNIENQVIVPKKDEPKVVEFEYDKEGNIIRAKG